MEKVGEYGVFSFLVGRGEWEARIPLGSCGLKVEREGGRREVVDWGRMVGLKMLLLLLLVLERRERGEVRGEMDGWPWVDERR